MQDGIRTGRRHRRAAFGVVGLVVSALVLGACTSSGGGSPSAGGSGGGQGAAATASGPPVAIDVTPAFDQPVADKAAVQKALTVTTSPAQQGAWYWTNSKEVHYRAQSYWQPGTTIHVVAKVYGLDFGNGVFGAEDRDVTYKVHDSWVAK